MYTYGLENELILLDPHTQNPQTHLGGKLANNHIIEVFASRYPSKASQGVVKPELDACQIEITNHSGHSSIQSARDELCELFVKVEGIIKECGLSISQNVVPNQIYTPTASDTQSRYATIMEQLQSAGIAKSTNIAGLHLNIGSYDRQTLIDLHTSIAHKVIQALDTNNIHQFMMSPDRMKHYMEIVKFMGGTPRPMVANYFDEQGTLLDQGYRLVRLKQYSDILITELRTPDAGFSLEDLSNKIQQVYRFVHEG